MAVNAQVSRRDDPGPPFYLPQAGEVELFLTAYRVRLPVMLKGPTGCGKTRLVQHVAQRLGRPLITVAGHEDLTAGDLLGRYLLKGAETVWVDGPLTRAVREGAVFYLDEVVEARQDTTVLIHPLTDDRRMLPVDRTGEILSAPETFMLVISFNPGYQSLLKELKPSTRQRFVAIELGYPPPDLEARIVERESGVAPEVALRLVALAGRLRALRDRGLAELPGTRLLVQAGRLLRAGVEPRLACRAALAEPLTDEPDLVRALVEVINASW